MLHRLSTLSQADSATPLFRRGIFLPRVTTDVEDNFSLVNVWDGAADIQKLSFSAMSRTVSLPSPVLFNSASNEDCWTTYDDGEATFVRDGVDSVSRFERIRWTISEETRLPTQRGVVGMATKG
jgi:hypothetical protein